MTTGYTLRAKPSIKKKKRTDWKKRMITIITMLLIANFVWDAYNRIPEVGLYSNQCYESTVKYSKIYYNKIFSKNQED